MVSMFSSVRKPLLSTGDLGTGLSEVDPGSPQPSLHLIPTDANINQLGADTAIGCLTNVP